MREAAGLGIRRAFTSYCDPKGNADTERLIRTIKDEPIWLREWSSVAESAGALAEFVETFNAEYLHPALGYRTPDGFERQWLAKNQSTLSAAA